MCITHRHRATVARLCAGSTGGTSTIGDGSTSSSSGGLAVTGEAVVGRGE